ncbi:amino acid permease-domain-containing protein [Pilobolus umbonatus]|nr:amino acid permease-domain-containing protein [Pilobolus umbonatus]
MSEKKEEQVVSVTEVTTTHHNTFFQSVTNRYNKVEPESYLRRDDETSTRFWIRRLGQIKPVELLWGEAEHTELERALSAVQLVFVGLGSIIGTGIFVLSGLAAAKHAGPAVTLSFLIAAFAAALAALSYSELASMIPVSGSAYTYAYATMGEFVAWTIGWDLILEYMVGAATVGVGWSGYFVKLIQVIGNVELSKTWTKPTIKWDEKGVFFFIEEGEYFNVPGFVIILLITCILVVGIKEAAWFNAVIVTIKILVILIFIFSLCGYLNPDNFENYIPAATDDWHNFGASGVFSAATLVFFSYIGFDAVTTAALEAKNPQRDLPIGVIGSLVISTCLYLVFCTIMTGAAHYTLLNVATPVTVAVDEVIKRTGINFNWLNIIVAIGAICGLTSVLLINILGQSRVFYAMAKDGLLPDAFAKVHPRFKTPYIATITIGIITATLSAILPVDFLGNMTSVGTLLAFFIVHLGVLIMRFTRPDIERRFAIPGGKYFSLVFPVLGMIVSIVLICVAEVTTIWRLFLWMALGWIIYFAYSIRHSRFRTDPVGRFREATLPIGAKEDSTGYQVEEYTPFPASHEGESSHKV